MVKLVEQCPIANVVPTTAHAMASAMSVSEPVLSTKYQAADRFSGATKRMREAETIEASGARAWPLTVDSLAAAELSCERPVAAG